MERIFTTLLFFTACVLAGAQDLITTNGGEEIRSKVIQVGLSEISYKKFDNLEGPTYMIQRSEVISILYENGTSDFCNDRQFEYFDTSGKQTHDQDKFLMGKIDADRYYRGYKTAGTSTLITSLLSPVLGLVPAIACASSAPSRQNLGYPSYNLMTEPAYKDGYTIQARKIKKNKVWMNWGIGLGANILAVLILAN